MIGFVLCVIGASLIISKGNYAELLEKGIGLGELAFLGSAFSWAAYTLIGRFIGTQFSSLAVIAYASSIGAVFLFFIALVDGHLSADLSTITWNATLNLLYLSLLATVLGFVWFQEGVKVLGAAKAAVFIYFMPVSALFWAYLILDEQFTPVLMGGAVLVILGVYLVNKKEAS